MPKLLKRTVKARRPLRKRKSYRKSKTGLVKLIQRTMLKKCETKDTHRILENQQLYHNVPNIQNDFLFTRQGMGDEDGGTSNYVARIGNEIVLRGLSMKIWLANKYDRPNVMYRIIVYRYKIDGSGYTNPPYQAQGTSNFMIRDLDTDRFKILKSKIVNLQVGLSGNASTTSGSSWAIYGKEAHKIVKFWIPFKNQKYKYKSDDSGYGAYWDIGLSITPYDSYGTLTTDNIASYALSHKLYFKDP